MGPGPHAEIVSPYFQHMQSLLTGAVILGEIDVNKLRLVTAKNLYLGFTSTFPPPKVVFKFDVNWGQVWKRLQNPVLDIMGNNPCFNSNVHSKIENYAKISDKAVCKIGRFIVF